METGGCEMEKRNLEFEFYLVISFPLNKDFEQRLRVCQVFIQLMSQAGFILLILKFKGPWMLSKNVSRLILWNLCPDMRSYIYTQWLTFSAMLNTSKKVVVNTVTWDDCNGKTEVLTRKIKDKLDC